MALAAGKAAFKASMKAKLLSMSNNLDQAKTPEESMDEYLDILADAIEVYIQNATINSIGLVAPNGPVTGITTLS